MGLNGMEWSSFFTCLGWSGCGHRIEMGLTGVFFGIWWVDDSAITPTACPCCFGCGGRHFVRSKSTRTLQFLGPESIKKSQLRDK